MRTRITARCSRMSASFTLISKSASIVPLAASSPNGGSQAMTGMVTRRIEPDNPLFRPRQGQSPSGIVLAPALQHALRRVERRTDRPARLDAADHEEVQSTGLALPLAEAERAQVGDEADDSLLRRVAPHQPVEDPDLARGAVVDHRAVEDRQHRVRLAQGGPVLGEDPPGRHRAVEGELVLVGDEDVEAGSAQLLRAALDELALVRREQRPREVDLHASSSSTGAAPGTTSAVSRACRSVVRTISLARAKLSSVVGTGPTARPSAYAAALRPIARYDSTV